MLRLHGGLVLSKDLNDYIKAKTGVPFAWGACDCILFTCDWCEVVTGVNPAQGAHGQYNCEESAYRYLVDNYEGQPEKYFDKYLSRCEDPVKGDVCLCDLNGSATFGIAGANGLVMFKTPTGLVATKLCRIKISWRVE